VSIVVAVPLAASVTEGELKLQVAPAGRLDAKHAKATVPEKPLTELIVKVVPLLDDPRTDTLIDDGFIDET
jgi:hypothetical protein